MSLHEDRFQYEGGLVSSVEREAAGEKLAKLGALRERFLLEAAAFAHGVKAIDPDFICRWERATRDKTASFEEVIVGFVDCVSDNVSELIDNDHVESLTRIEAEGIDD
jgi:hypothetical protein